MGPLEQFWLMKEAKKRNPGVLTYGLIWGAPGWVNNQTGFYGEDLLQYQVKWLQCARDSHGITVDYLGFWNEREWGSPSYTKQLRAAVTAAGFSTELVLGDDDNAPPVMQYANDSEFMNAFSAVGLHASVGCAPLTEKLGGQAAALQAAGKRLWMTEGYDSLSTWGGAAGWVKALSQNFIRANLTFGVAWATLWSVYPVVDFDEGTVNGSYAGPGFIYAWEPWSGHYEVTPTVWTAAHYNQFVSPGWHYLRSGSLNLGAGGTMVSMVSPDRTDITIVIESAASGDCTSNGKAIPAQNLTVQLTGWAQPKPLSVWRSNAESQFERISSLSASGTIVLRVDPESIYTVSSTTGQRRGSFGSAPPASTPFPMPWNDSFDSSAAESSPRFWSDQCGSWQVVPAARASGGGGMVVRQRVTERPGVNGDWDLASPLTIIGSPTLSGGSSIEIQSRIPLHAFVPGSRAETAGMMAPGFINTTFVYAKGEICAFPPTDWATLVTDTLANAEALCAKTVECQALTFQADSVDPTGTLGIWLTSKAVVGGSNCPQKPNWHSYFLSPQHKPASRVASLDGAFVGLCNRVWTVKNGPVGGICLQLNATKDAELQGALNWRVLVNSGPGVGGAEIATGAVHSGVRMSEWHRLGLTIGAGVPMNVTATLDGQQLGDTMLVRTSSVSAGMVAIQSGWHEAEYDDFRWFQA